MKCSICKGEIEQEKHPVTGKVFWTEGHNAEPINNGRCCGMCNQTKVIPERMKRMGK